MEFTVQLNSLLIISVNAHKSLTELILLHAQNVGTANQVMGGELTIGKLHPIWTNTAESSRTGYWVLNLKLCKSNIGRTVCLLYMYIVYASGKCGICNTVRRNSMPNVLTKKN